MNKSDILIAKKTLLLLEKKSWENIKLNDLKTNYKKSLKTFKSKNDLLKNLNRYIDYCLNIEIKSIETSSPKDMLFEVIMARFDILQKNRKSFVMLYDYFKLKPQKLLFLLPSFLESMLITASLAKINIKGINGSITIKGIFVIYIATFFKWVDDTSNSLEKTMTVLDQYLTYVLKIKKYINR
tara:strand:- start:615 stop:1163 length:549 start_codon:yes stop_codon:yes gene_type:complete